MDSLGDEGPSLYAVLATPALKEAYRWHCIETLSPENLLFLDRVDEYWRPLFADQAERTNVRAVADDIFKRFFDKDACYEVSLPALMKARLRHVLDGAAPLTEDSFSEAYDEVCRDLARSLSVFLGTDFYASYAKHKSLVDALFQEHSDPVMGAANRVRDVAAELQVINHCARVRSLFRSFPFVPCANHGVRAALLVILVKIVNVCVFLCVVCSSKTIRTTRPVTCVPDPSNQEKLLCVVRGELCGHLVVRLEV
jgi:hypothetical protein